MKRFSRYVLLPLGTYAWGLAALGPFSALEGHGLLNFIPHSIREACWYPTVPVWMIHGVESGAVMPTTSIGGTATRALPTRRWIGESQTARESETTVKRFWRHILLLPVLYAGYLAALGPLYSLEARGWLDLIPQGVRQIAWLPAFPVIRQHGVRRAFSAYLDWWYLDPNAVEPPLDW